MALINEHIAKDEILKAVKEAMDEHLYSYAFEGILGLDSEIEGKEDTLKALSDKLDKILKS